MSNKMSEEARKAERLRAAEVVPASYHLRQITELEAEIERLRAELAVVLTELETEIERLRAVNKLAVEQNFKDHAEIERLRAALRDIADLRYDNTSAASVARRALEGK